MTINKINVTEALANAEKMIRENKSASPQFRAMVELLIVVINLLLNKLSLNSNNSSIPPSKDPKRPRGSKRKAKGRKRKPGGQIGHEGSTLEKVEHPDEIETLEVDRRSIPRGQYTEMGFDARQVIDIKITKHVTEYRAQILQAEDGTQYVAEFPAGLTRPVQYGNTIKAQSVYMSQQQLVPYERVRDYFADQCGIPVSPGSIFNFNKQAYELLDRFESIVKQHLKTRPLLHADETGINLKGKLLWLHSVSDDRFTLFFTHEKRGADGMKAMGVLEHFQGILCHDHWKPYFQFKCIHVLCNAHHLRELERAWEQENQCWAKQMQDLLLEMNEATTKAGDCLDKTTAENYRCRYRSLLKEGEKECPPPEPTDRTGKRGRVARSKPRNLLERLRDFEAETLRFMIDKRVPFTNNQGENDLRMTKVQQKISGCFRSFEGAQFFCRIRSYLSTCRKHGISPTEALEMLFDGRLPDFIVKLE
jgi:transposase